MNSERATVNLVVGFLGLVVLFGMGIGGYLAVFDKGVPDFIVATTSGAIGALGAMLAKTSASNEPQQVVVANAVSDAVPTTDVPPPKRTRGQAGQALLWFIVGCLAAIVLLALAGRLAL